VKVFYVIFVEDLKLIRWDAPAKAGISGAPVSAPTAEAVS
jgi:hypothetical protein